MSDLQQWLESLGLGRYADVFAENDIDSEALADLTEQDLATLGVSLGHRKKLFRAISEYCSSPPQSPVTAREWTRPIRNYQTRAATPDSSFLRPGGFDGSVGAA
jgi:hypothetical protein